MDVIILTGINETMMIIREKLNKPRAKFVRQWKAQSVKDIKKFRGEKFQPVELWDCEDQPEYSRTDLEKISHYF